MTIYTIPAKNLDPLFGRLDRINKVAHKLGLPSVTMTEVSRETRELIDAGKPTGLFYEWVTLEISGEAPRVNGWAFVARIDHTDQGNVIRNITDQPVPAVYRTIEANCDHCHTQRGRLVTFVLRSDTDGYKQVGSSCLIDFLGHPSPHTLAAYLEDLNALADGLSGEPEYTEEELRGGGSALVDSLNLVTHVVTMIGQYGWISRTAARERQCGSTADHAMNNMLSPKFGLDYIKPTPEDRQTAEAAIEWARALTPVTEYEWNLKTVAGPNYCRPHHIGILASVVAAYRRSQTQRSDGSAEPSQYIGSVGDKVTLDVTIDRLTETSGYYGITTVVGMRAGANKLTWFASGQPDLTEGKSYTIKGTIKNHEVYAGANVTYLTRCKIIAERITA